MSFNIKKESIIGCFVLLFELPFILSMNAEASYRLWALISTTQLILHLAVIWNMGKTRIISFASFFIVLTAIFHCGHILILGFGIPGVLNLDFTLYGDVISRIGAFKFYLYSQLLLAIGILISDGRFKDKAYPAAIDMKRSSKVLVLIGIFPRLYVDIEKFLGGLKSGYEGVYSKYIPQPVNTLAFFFDVGVMIALLQLKKCNKGCALFWGILIYKSLAMITGARQEKVGFLVIWILIYFFIISEVHFINIIKFSLVLVVGIAFIGTIGETRSDGSFTLNTMFAYFSNNTETSILGNFLGEFGSAFSSLVVPFQQIPSTVGFGLGKSYIAGLLSVVPLLVSKLPSLSKQTAFVVLFSGTTYFGGSMIGEAYYNFGWFGLVVMAVVGYTVKRVDIRLMGKTYKDYCPVEYIMAFVIAVSMLIFVRGYFNDMVQKSIWIYIALKLINRNCAIIDGDAIQC